MGNLVAIVGRPNVGKSTFFNRLVGGRLAIVDEQSGVTRDRHYGRSEWNGISFGVIDTGGYVSGSDDIFEREIRDQVDMAIIEADLIVFMVDVTVGMTDLDERVAQLLRKSKKKVYVVSNKVDSNKLEYEGTEFYGFGLGEVYNISAMNGTGTGELLDDLVKEMSPEVEVEDNLPNLAIIGQPNVGKSSLLNALTGTERSIVTPRAGTTRDPINMHYNSFGFEFNLVDTAGLRKKAKVNEGLEFYSNLRAVRSIEAADVCLLLIDATEGITAQDVNIIFLIEKHHKGLVILVNKWDLVEKDTMSTLEYTKKIEKKIAPFTDVPIVFTSVLEKQRIHKALEIALDVYKNRSIRITTSKLNEVMLPIMEKTPPPISRGRVIKVKYVTQLPGRYPQFAFFCNHPQHVKEAYARYLENQMRKIWNFSGIPIEIFFRQK